MNRQMLWGAFYVLGFASGLSWADGLTSIKRPVSEMASIFRGEPPVNMSVSKNGLYFQRGASVNILTDG